MINAKFTFDKMRCIANIYMLAKQKNIKIGTLESKAGVSIGYLSRLNKADNTASPSIECLTTMAAELEISLDVLINAELAKLTSTEEYILNFLKRLLNDTETDKIIWLRETQQELEQLAAETDDHPLFGLVTKQEIIEDYMKSYDVLEYIPVEKGNMGTVINGDCFHVPIYGDAEVYITNIQFEDQSVNENDYDVFLVNGKERNALCSTRNVKSEISVEIVTLYQSIKNSMHRLHLNKNIRNIIEGYVENKPVPTTSVSLTDEEIPF